jgi:diazepam-binding inhibitor (GABA receptor modulator, acyl-CoA-binding protein)
MVLWMDLVWDFLQEEFEEYAEKAKALPETISNESKLILYANYKQATVGPVNIST